MSDFQSRLVEMSGRIREAEKAYREAVHLLDFAKRAGEDVRTQEISLEEKHAKIMKWKAALQAEGMVI